MLWRKRLKRYVRLRTVLHFSAAGLSALLLWTGFRAAPGSGSAAWFALVPLLLLIDDLDGPRSAFKWGWGCGCAAWLLSLTWLWRLIANGGPWSLVLLGYLALSVYCGFYVGLFAAAVKRLERPKSIPGRCAYALIPLPLLWVGAEFLRSTLFTGFAWGHLGTAQFRNLPLIQSAEWGGVYAVSAVIVMVNAGMTAWIRRLAGLFRERFRLHGLPCELFCSLLVLMGVWMWGRGRMVVLDTGMASEGYTAHLAALQPNAPSIFTWNDDVVENTRRFLLRHTELAAVSKPDLIVWPETSVMGTLPADAEAMRLVAGASNRSRTWLLTGAMESEWIRTPKAIEPELRIYNSSWLFGPDGTPANRYRKQHLVPFGEFIPLDKWIPLLQRWSPIGFSCYPGEDSVVMQVPLRTSPGKMLRFSPLICFEDTVASLSRQAVRAGAHLLVNQTNDAWFEGSVEPFQHMVQSIFRAVENRVPLFRCANSGVTCLVDPVGRLNMLLDSDGRKHGFEGLLLLRVRVSEQPVKNPTLYNRMGDWTLAIPGAVLLLLMLSWPPARRGFRIRTVRTGCARQRQG